MGDARFPGNALALLVGGLSTWRQDGDLASLAAKLVLVDQILWEKSGTRN